MEEDKRELGDIVTNIMVHSQMLVSGIDDLESETIFRQELKKTGNLFRKHCEKAMDDVHDKLSAEGNKYALLCYDDYLSILHHIDKLTVKDRNEFKILLPAIIAGVSKDTKALVPYRMKKENLENMSNPKLVDRIMTLQKILEVKTNCIDKQIEVIDEYRGKFLAMKEQIEIIRIKK